MEFLTVLTNRFMSPRGGFLILLKHDYEMAEGNFMFPPNNILLSIHQITVQKAFFVIFCFLVH